MYQNKFLSNVKTKYKEQDKEGRIGENIEFIRIAFTNMSSSCRGLINK